MTSGNGHTGGLAGAMVVAGPTLAKAQPDQSRAFEPGSIAEAMHMAALLVKSRLLPDSVQSPEAAFAIIATGRELGLTAMQSLRSIHVIKGKTILSADLVAALVKSRRDVCAFFMLVESTTERATYKTQRVGEPEATTLSFTMDDAKRAQVTGNPNWTKYPAAMLRARCITALARAVYPDLAMGVYDPDEIAGEPVAPPQVYEPVPSRAAPTAAPPDLTQFATLRDAVDSADSAASLNGCARATQKAHRSGVITDAQLQTIVNAVKAKRTAIDAPAPPPSEPKTEEVQ
jgi:hypothetical protein